MVCFGRLTFEWELYWHNGSNVDPTDKNKMVKFSDLKEMSTASIYSLNLVVKANKLPPNTYHTAIFKAFRPSGQFGEYLHTFITNSPPENGESLLDRHGVAKTQRAPMVLMSSSPWRQLKMHFISISVRTICNSGHERSRLEKRREISLL